MVSTKDISMHSFLAEEPNVEVTAGHVEEKKGNMYDQRDMQRMGKRQDLRVCSLYRRQRQAGC
jgi:hypothetical protein